MRKAHELVPSRHMDRPIHLWRYGEWGAPLLVFPTAAGMAHARTFPGYRRSAGNLYAAGGRKRCKLLRFG